MKCTVCGAELADGVKFCTSCGATAATPVAPVAPAAPPAKEVKLLGPWGYFGLKILFSIPLVGFILLIVFSLDGSHLNRRNFARSYWCDLILGVVVTILLAIILSASGVIQDFMDMLAYGY